VLATPKLGEGGSPAKVQLIAADTAASTGNGAKEEVNVLTREAAERHGKSSLLLRRTHDRNYFYSTVGRVTTRGIHRHVKDNVYRFHAPVVAVCVARRQFK
jgi:hypothetical protein